MRTRKSSCEYQLKLQQKTDANGPIRAPGNFMQGTSVAMLEFLNREMHLFPVKLHAM